MRGFRRMGRLLALGLLGGGTPAVHYLLRDEFTTDDAAPLTSPRTCEPGPGSLTAVELDGSFSIGGGKLLFTAQTTPVFGDQRIFDATAHARADTPAFIFTLNIDTQAVGKEAVIGWNAAVTGAYLTHAFYPNSNTILRTYNTADSRIIGNAAQGIDYKMAVIIRPTKGAFYILQGGAAFPDPTLIWIDTAGSVTPLYAGLSNSSLTGSLDNFKIYKAPSGWQTDFGPATHYIAAPVDGQLTTSTPDGMVDLKWTPAANETLNIMFRWVDDNNCWIVRCDQAGSTIRLYEKAAGVETQRATAAYTWTVGTKFTVRVRFSGNTVDGWASVEATHSPAQVWSYGSAAFQNTATGVKVVGFATASDLVAWPRTVSLPFDLVTAARRNILPVGDSKTANYAWPEELCTSLTNATPYKWQESPARIAANNYTVAMRLADADADLAAASGTPQYIFINLGANDCTSLPAEATWKANYLALVDKYAAKWPGVPMYLTKPWRRTYDAACDTLAGWIDTVIAQRAFLHPADDERGWMEGGDNGVTMTGDGIHYSSAGTTEKAAQMVTVLGF
jgi:lysophospholipase L1-like esterase